MRTSLLSLLSIAVAATASRNVRLTEDNFLVFRGPVTGVSASNFINELASKRNASELYVYLITPGGSVTAGMQVAQSLQALANNGVNVTCISDVALSMGFVITQHCPNRLVMDSSILMQHQIALGLEGPLRNVNNYLGSISRYGNRLDTVQADRIGLSLEDFQEHVRDDWWLFGAESTEEGVADETVNVYCDFYSSKPDYQVFHTPFGDVRVAFSKCPVARDPLSISFGRTEDSSEDETVVDVPANSTAAAHFQSFFDNGNYADLSSFLRNYYFGAAVPFLSWGDSVEVF